MTLSSLATIQNHHGQSTIAELGRISLMSKGIGRRKLVISSMAVILLVLALVLALGRSSHAILGAGAAGSSAASVNGTNSNGGGDGAMVPGGSSSAGDSSTADDTITTNSSSLNVNLNSSSTVSSDPAASSSAASLSVNGQSVPVKNPNSIHKVIKNTGSNGNTEVNISVQNNSSGGAM